MVIVIHCKDEVGLVATISAVIAKAGCNIVSMREHVDVEANQFFARLVVENITDSVAMEQNLLAVLPANAVVNVNPQPEKNIVVLVTKEYHCLSDILTRNHFKTLGAQVSCVVGNHPDLANLCERFHIPFKLVSHLDKSKEDFEQELIAEIAPYKPDYVILAKFMRILSPNFISKFPLKIINIHHSFLPAFIGANPYKQAYLRGVKIIGATAHFVTNDLDEGPIITQKITPVNHSFSLKDLVRAGRENETSALAKAMQLAFEDRVFVYDNKTVVFE
ncbi:formyltetrahydrofolate deformylase [Pelobium manganitolerans]|uniref:Formyltetrahydrofolate deformylase n=1 Tax=Pelobium manganitolerans TaxID=1842495 RepID=A0A419S5H9_9SPHI|nr:formyltetrahydrofolate deformylase [Pelobium manganitolerans]RKD16063.1 formyltetrahydrofolate deformylase [Pelobium manganitolerans]